MNFFRKGWLQKLMPIIAEMSIAQGTTAKVLKMEKSLIKLLLVLNVD
jgi:hypothetical protein